MWPQSPGYVLCHQHAHRAWCHQLHGLFSGTARFQQQDSASQMIPFLLCLFAAPWKTPASHQRLSWCLALRVRVLLISS